MTFGESVSPVAAIQAILHDYPFSASILRELLQNSDDAGASKQIFVLDKGDNPALIAYNDSEFLEADWQAIQTILKSSKRADTSKIGKYGVGFRACYHITDQPQILSGPFFAILDPLYSNGMKIEHDKFKTTEYCKHFNFFSSMFERGSFTGTAIRLPLRSTRSELSDNIVLASKLQKMIADYISEEFDVSLLFLDKLKTIEIWETSNGAKTRLAMRTRSGMTSSRQDPSVSFVTYNIVLSDGNTENSWRIVQTQSPDNEAISYLSQLVGVDSVNLIVQKHKLRPDVRIAYPLTSNKGLSGRLFTFLPLPSRTGFQIHIHALFALTSSRQGLRNPNETGIVQGSDNDVLIKWNHLLFNHYIPRGWGYLLKTLAEEAICGNILSEWPPYYSSITSGDGVYWQDILSKTFKIVVESGLKVWPKISSEATTTYVELKSSLIVAQGQVDRDTLTVLASLGLTLVQLPQSLLNLVDESMIKLTPTVAHGKLQGELDRFGQLSYDQRGLVCKYLLSDGDIANIFELPLIRILNGNFVALDHRNKTLQRFIVLTKGEATVFRTSACDAIPLDDLSPNMARLLREQGINRANVDLLGPRHVIDYLSSEAQILSDERLKEFWCWAVDWHLKEELISLLKQNSALWPIPTTKGPQPVSSPVFDVIPDKNNAQVFGKLGLAFITSILPPSVVALLLNHTILKNANNLNHFVTAVDLNSMPALTDEEAETIFNHVMDYYGPVTADALTKLRTLPIFPVMVPDKEPTPSLLSNSSVTWRDIYGITIKGMSPLKLVPVADNVHFLSKSNIGDKRSPVLKQLPISTLKDKDILLHSLDLFASQPKSLQVAFVSYIKLNQSRLPIVKQELQKTAFLRVADGSLQSPKNIIDPGSPLADLFPQDCKDSRIPVNVDEYDKQLFDHLRDLGLTTMNLESHLVQERIAYISSNSTSPEVVAVARSLLALMNKPMFSCHGLTIDSNMSWLPTAKGLVTSKKCINSGRRDTDLFDEVLVTLDESISISPSFKEFLGWDSPFPLEILAEQLRRVLESSFSDVQIRKIRNIIKDLSTRQLNGADVQSIQTAVDGRAWIPTKSNQLAQPSRAVFMDVDISSGFHEVGFSKSDKEIYQFLCKIGCLERPTAAAITEELNVLQEQSREDGTVFRRAIMLLEMLPDPMTKEELASLLVPNDLGYLVPLNSGICYYGGRREAVDANDGIAITHHLVTEQLAEKLGMGRLGLEIEDDIDLGGSPMTTIRNTLKQYSPQQFFTEFVANASDAKAKQFSLFIDHHEGPTDLQKLFSPGMAPFQSASLVVYNDGVFDKNDFRGIRDTGVGGKSGKSDVIGYFGLGALSMFRFTEMAMIVSGGHVLFLNPAKHSLRYRDRNSVLLTLHHVKRLYRGHLEPLDGLFGFDLNSTEPYKGTIFRLPLRNQSHLIDEANAVSAEAWSTTTIKDLLLNQFDSLAYKSLLFTGLNQIDILDRRGSHLEILRSIKVVREPVSSITEAPFEPEMATFQTANGQMKWLTLSRPVNIPEEFEKGLQGRSNILPLKIAAALDGDATSTDGNFFCALPLPVTTSLPVHVSAPFILEQERRNIRLDNFGGVESKYNQWLLSSEIPSLYLYLLEALLLTQGANEAWWPPAKNSGNTIASQVFIDVFWTPEVLGSSSRRIFASRTNPSTYLTPKDAILLCKTHSYIDTLSKIVDISGHANVVEFPETSLAAAMKADLHFIDAVFVKSLLQNYQVCPQLVPLERLKALLFLCSNGVPLHGLPLLPLEDGSYGTISLKSSSDSVYYVVDQASDASFPPFRKNRLVNRLFKTFLLDNGLKGAWERLLKENNVSLLSDKGIVELTKEFIEPAKEFVGDDAHETWVVKFWRAKLTKPQTLSHFPLVSTYKPLHYISLQMVDDPSVIVLQDKPSEELSHCYAVLQKLGLTIVVRRTLPSHLRAAVKLKTSGPYPSFLNFVQRHPDKLVAMQQLIPRDQQILSWWIRSHFSLSKEDFDNVGIRSTHAPVVKNLLQEFQICQQLNESEKMTVLVFLCSSNISLHGLPLLPLEDGSYATISSKVNSDWTYYVVDQASDAAYLLFRKDRLMRREFKSIFLRNGHITAWKRLLDDNNVSLLYQEGIVELMEEFIEPADEFVGDDAYETWVNDFWRSWLTKPEAVFQFPLVSTSNPLHYVSLQKIDDPSVIVLEDKPSEQHPHFTILQKLGLIIVVRRTLPLYLPTAVKRKELDAYSSFLKFVEKYPNKLTMMQLELTADDQEILCSWIRSHFSSTPEQFANIACQIPVWPVQEGGNNTRLAALNDNDVTILPPRMPATVLTPFTTHAIMDWNKSMKSVKTKPCTTQRIVELLRVSADTVIRSAERNKYKEFIKIFVKMDRDGEHPLLVPNSNFVLRPASDLFESTELFTATFKPGSPLLFSQNFEDLAEDLEKYGLKRQHNLDLSMFIECAAAFDSDRDRNKRSRGEVLYRYFNSLRLSPEDIQRCRELDNFKFIPRIDKKRAGYGDIDTIQYMTEDLQRGLLAPAQITVPNFEAICWSQKGSTDPPPNLTLCGTYQSLGKPDGSDVLGHLLVLIEIARDHGRHTGLLSDLRATYKWLNDNADEVADLISPRYKDNLFLNVDDPKSETWVWHSAFNLVIGAQDRGEIREVKGFLQNYSDLLNAAGVRRIQKGDATEIPAGEDTPLDCREQINELRRKQLDTDVAFLTSDCLHQIFAHKLWLVINNTHFRTLFMSGMRESQLLGSNHIVRVDRSSMCVEGVIDWFYVGKLPERLTNSSSGDGEETKQRLYLALEMLSLADEWGVTDLHLHLQAFITKNHCFFDPYSVGKIRQYAEVTTANHLLKFCQDFEERNQSLIDDFAGGGVENDDDE